MEKKQDFYLIPTSEDMKNRKTNDFFTSSTEITIDLTIDDTDDADPVKSVDPEILFLTNFKHPSARELPLFHFSCTLCGEKLASFASYKLHLNSHTIEENFTCKVCSKNCMDSFSLRRHESLHTSSFIEEKTFKTDVFHKANSSEHDLTLFEKVHTEEGQFKCDVCKEILTDMSSLTLSPSSGRSLICCLCREVLSSHNQGDDQVQIENSAQNPVLQKKTVKGQYACDLCPKRFTQKRSYNKHSALHKSKSVLEFKCDVCSKFFKQRRYLTRHKILHTGEKSFKCDICSKSFYYKYRLTSHEKNSHYKVKPFECNECFETFMCKYKLEEHKHTHTKIPFYRCEFCNKSYIHKELLELHLLIHIN
ncbi:zinc finger protein 92-like [Physella acuta]|uniref:zinc finger protein 92-like n=1 Tax=Physella acuta TaxID=109671 RepID=UPI0027DD63BD|nr:zinc finger protein 92-like [Physella acuta]XP_059139803.1 zinc finger protein 92-like [Physella acuta]